MEISIAHTVSIDDRPDCKYVPMPDRDDDLAVPSSMQLHDQARFFLEQAPRLRPQQGIGLCGIVLVDPAKSQPAMIYLWPLQTPYTIDGAAKTNVPGLESVLPWPVNMGWPDFWCQTLETSRTPALKQFRENDKNLHVFPAANGLSIAAAHSQLYVAIIELEPEKKTWSSIGFTLYYNLNNAGPKGKDLKSQPYHHLLRFMSRSQNRRVFVYEEEENWGKVPKKWATAIKTVFDAYFH